MSLFGPTRPKGITKEELYFVRGELTRGTGPEKLSDRQAEYVMELLEMALDADTAIEARNRWEQVNASEAAAVEEKIGDNDALTFTSKQRERVHSVLAKYLNINKVKSFF